MKEKAFAKVNLFLDVVGKRLDNYHNLETIMAPLALHDVLTFTMLEERRIEVITNIHVTDEPEDNLIYKIAAFILETYNINKGVRIELEKNIPIAAGLAGGSADAAATLRGLNKLFKLKLNLDLLAEIGERFGADIPFCVHNKLCIARGKGESLVFLNKKLNMPILLITPKVHVSTKAIFNLVNVADLEHQKITNISNAIYNCNKPLLMQSLFNALEPISFKKFPEIKQLKDDVLKEGVSSVLMSGTGPTVFVLSENKQDLDRLNNKYRSDYQVNLTKIT